MALNYYDTENVIITSQPIELDPESNLYQSEDVWKKYKRLSRKITVLNVGPGILYVRSSHDGTYFSEEAVVYEGNSKYYDEIYCIKLRSPSANLRYRFTEYDVSTVSGQQFSGSRFKDRRDRDGVIVFQDDYESPTIKCERYFTPFLPPQIPTYIIPPPASILRSTDISFSGDFSMKTIGGSVNGDHVTILYRHPDFHEGKVANQIHFATQYPAFEIELQLDYYDGKEKHQAFVAFWSKIDSFLNPLPVELYIRTQTRNSLPPYDIIPKDIKIPTNITIFRETFFSWNVLKLTIDISSSKYVAVFVNGTRIDLSGFDMYTSIPIPAVTEKHIDSFVSNVTQEFDRFGPTIVYFDNYLFTEDETFT